MTFLMKVSLPQALSPVRGYAVALTLLLIALLTLACGDGTQGNGTPGGDASEALEETPRTEEVATHWASGNANDLRTLLHTSDEVFFGRVAHVLGQSETELPPGIAKDRAALPITSFEIAVESVMAGSLSPGAPVVIEQVGGTIDTSAGARMSIILEHDKLLVEDAEYLFFAAYKSNGTLSVAPFGRLQVSRDGSLEPLPIWSDLGALRQLSGLTASDAASRVRQSQ